MDIQVYRPKQYADMTRNYQLFADNTEVATLKRGETTTVSIPDGTEYIQAKIDWCSSQELKVSDLKGTQLTVKNNFSGNILKALFCTLYYISLGKSKYLKIEQDDALGEQSGEHLDEKQGK